MIYTAAFALFVKYLVGGGFRLDLPGLHAAFIVLFLYATLSVLVGLYVMEYPNYEFLSAAITLKSGPFEFAILFALFFHGVRTSRDAASVVNVFLTAFGVANVFTVLDATGILPFGIIPIAEGGENSVDRVQGALGEANAHAAICALVIPAQFLKMLTSRGAERGLGAVWFLAGVAVMFMTASRGAIFGLIVAIALGLWLFRRFLVASHVIRAALAIFAALALAAVVFAKNYLGLIVERMFVQTLDSNVVEASSGRSEIWKTAVGVMVDHPLSFLTGFGWDVYSSMPFEFAPHNSYLEYWFNLGLTGLTCFVLILAFNVAMARRAAMAADDAMRGLLCGFTVGLIALSVLVFFVQLSYAWLYVWIFSGLTMRIAVEASPARAISPQEQPITRATPRQRKPPFSATQRYGSRPR